MQFREQGKKIQCIRSTYDPAVKRSNQTVVASFSRYADELPSAELADLTDIERHELDAWFADKRIEKSLSMSRYRVTRAALDLADLSQSIPAVGVGLTADQAAVIWSGLAAVGRALKKAGHPKPKRVIPPAVVSGQSDLLSGV